MIDPRDKHNEGKSIEYPAFSQKAIESIAQA